MNLLNLFCNCVIPFPLCTRSETLFSLFAQCRQTRNTALHKCCPSICSFKKHYKVICGMKRLLTQEMAMLFETSNVRHVYRLQIKFGEGYAFTGVCQSLCSHLMAATRTRMVGKQVVNILLECFLVYIMKLNNCLYVVTEWNHWICCVILK